MMLQRPFYLNGLLVTGLYILAGSMGLWLYDKNLDGKDEWFLIFSAFLCYWLIARFTAYARRMEGEAHQVHQELSAAYEELVASEEELRQQFEELLENGEKIRRQNECLFSLHETAITLINRLDIDELLHTILEKAVAVGQAQRGVLYLFNANKNVMELKLRIGQLNPNNIGFERQKGEGIIGKAWETGEPLFISHCDQWDEHIAGALFAEIKTMLAIPLRSGRQVSGVFGLGYTEYHTMSEEEHQLLIDMAELASLALDGATMYRELRESEQHIAAMLEAVPDHMFEISLEGIISWINHGQGISAFKIAGQVEGKNIQEIFPAHIAEQVLSLASKASKTGITQTYDYEILLEKEHRFREMRLVSLGENKVLIMLRDVTDQKLAEQRLLHFSFHDKLCGVYNRMYFEEQLQALNTDECLPVGIIVCDLDGLKLVNDTFGHVTGDQILITTATIISSAVDKGIVARIGGDEFAVLLPFFDMGDTEKTKHHIREAIEEYNATEPPIPLSISMGAAVRMETHVELAEVFVKADDRMYREKLHRSQSARSSIVHTLASALEARDFVTDGHADRLQDIVDELGRKIGLPDSSMADLRLLARFHDIGKVGIPDAILFKPSRLTDDEFQTMKRHCEIGYRIAQSAPDLAPIAECILKHQEWWNGQGYPLGLQGEDIPLPCRILAIADAYDAMTNDRPYRQALSHEEALAELARCAGTQFDPVLVDVFLKLNADKKAMG